jgi:hypothetical protein
MNSLLLKCVSATNLFFRRTSPETLLLKGVSPDYILMSFASLALRLFLLTDYSTTKLNFIFRYSNNGKSNMAFTLRHYI